jgi:hypothetical protein
LSNDGVWAAEPWREHARWAAGLFDIVKPHWGAAGLVWPADEIGCARQASARQKNDPTYLGRVSGSQPKMEENGCDMTVSVP